MSGFHVKEVKDDKSRISAVEIKDLSKVAHEHGNFCNKIRVATTNSLIVCSKSKSYVPILLKALVK